MEFKDLGLGQNILRAIDEMGYRTPTPIQEQSIPAALTGRDILGCAQTGTGKTASFVLPMIETLATGRARARMPRSLILSPTRELAIQTAEYFDAYGKYHKLNHALLIGGVSMDDQIRRLAKETDVVIATPGRFLDHYENGRIILSNIKILVVDEADRMLDMGFIPDVEKIVANLPRIRQTLFFSATMPADIRRLADAFLINPKEVQVAPPASPAETVDQNLVVVPERDKRGVLCGILNSENVHNALIFCNRKRDVDILHRSLKKHGFSVSGLHGDMSQPMRQETLDAFRSNQIRLLVASDVAARGLDIDDLSHVFNFDVPYNPEDYVHRIGRTGRAGKEGRAFSIATPADSELVSAIETLIGKEIPRADIAGAPAAEPVPASPPSRNTHRRAKPDADRARHAKRPAKAQRAPEADKPVVGMGAHVPAFLLRPGRDR